MQAQKNTHIYTHNYVHIETHMYRYTIRNIQYVQSNMQTLRTSEVQNKKIKKIILLIIQYGNCITSTDLHAEVHTDTHKYKKAKKGCWRT